MSDHELFELRRANPVSVAEVSPLVAVDRALLTAVLDADRTSATTRRTARIGYAGAAAAAVAAFALPLALLSSGEGVDDGDIVEAPADVREEPAPELVGDVASTLSAPSIVPARPPERDDARPAPATAPTSPPDVTAEPAMSSPPTTPEAAPVVTTTLPRPPAAPSATAAPPPTLPAPASTAPTEPVAPTFPPIDGPLRRGLDLLVITLDFGHLDDGHAAVADRELAETYGLDPLVVAGTQDPSAGTFDPDDAAMMRAAWDDRWLDATADRPGALALSVDRWLRTIDAGGVVWVAEGGVSDFTAEVVAAIRQRRPDLDTASVIHVVQHARRNEVETRAGDLDAVKAGTTYTRIDDGNTLNDTADLNGPSDAFEAAALSGRNASRWTAAFEFMPASSLDFSDTVTVLHVLGVGLDQVAGADDFAAAFLR